MALLPADPKKRRMVIIGVAAGGAVVLYLLTRSSSSTPATTTVTDSGLPADPTTSAVTDPGTGSSGGTTDPPAGVDTTGTSTDPASTDPPQITIVMPGADPTDGDVASGGNATPGDTSTTPAGATTPANVTTRPSAAQHNGAALTTPAPARATSTTVKAIVKPGATMGPVGSKPAHGAGGTNVPKGVIGKPKPLPPAPRPSSKPSVKRTQGPPAKGKPPPRAVQVKKPAPHKLPATPPHKRK